MVEWTLNGKKETDWLLERLDDPEKIRLDFDANYDEFPENFTLDMQIKIYEIMAKTLIAKAIFDFPEFASDQFFKAFNCGEEIKLNLSGHLNIEDD